jgi:hypothetical protein
MGIEGSVMVRYVVDSFGRADLATLKIVRATRIEFAVAVREALILRERQLVRPQPEQVHSRGTCVPPRRTNPPSLDAAVRPNPRANTRTSTYHRHQP